MTNKDPIRGIDAFVDEIYDTCNQTSVFVGTRPRIKTILLAFAAHAKRQSLPAFIEMEKALASILRDPHGCRFCDSGKLRNPQKDHDTDCGYPLALSALGRSSWPSQVPTKADDV